MDRLEFKKLAWAFYRRGQRLCLYESWKELEMDTARVQSGALEIYMPISYVLCIGLISV